MKTEAYEEIVECSSPGGYMILVVPAYDWLMSKEHHRAVRAVRTLFQEDDSRQFSPRHPMQIL